MSETPTSQMDIVSAFIERNFSKDDIWVATIREPIENYLKAISIRDYERIRESIETLAQQREILTQDPEVNYNEVLQIEDALYESVRKLYKGITHLVEGGKKNDNIWQIFANIERITEDELTLWQELLSAENLESTLTMWENANKIDNYSYPLQTREKLRDMRTTIYNMGLEYVFSFIKTLENYYNNDSENTEP